MEMKCEDTLEVQGIGIVYCRKEASHSGWHEHRHEGLVDVEWQRNPLRVKSAKSVTASGVTTNVPFVTE